MSTVSHVLATLQRPLFHPFPNSGTAITSYAVPLHRADALVYENASRAEELKRQEVERRAAAREQVH